MPTTGTMRYLTIGDSTYEVYNTDTEVVQTYAAANGYTNWRPLVVGYSSNSSETTAPTTTTGTTYTFNTIKVKPSDGTIRFGAAALYNGDYTTTISADTLTASRTLTAPNKSGTIALVSDIPDVSGYAPLTSPVFTGTPTAPTPGGSAGDTEIATVKYVQDAMSGAGAGTVTSVGVSNDTNGGLSISGSPITTSGTITVGHSNVLTSAQTTQAVYPIKIDKNGHISEYGSAVAIPTKVSDLTNDSGFITSYTETDPVFSASAAAGISTTDISNWNAKSDTDEKLKWTASTSSNTYYPLQSTSTATTSTANTLDGISFYQYYNTAGGYRRLILGNSTAYKSSGGAYGTIRLYGAAATYYGELVPGVLGTASGDGHISANRTWTLPDKTGTIALTSDIPTITDENVKVQLTSVNTSYDLLSIPASGTIPRTTTTNTNGDIQFQQTDSASILTVGGDELGKIQLRSKSGGSYYSSTIVPSHTTTGRTITLPDATGTVALTSNIPTAVSELTNDSGFITDAGVTSFNGSTGAITYTAPVTSVNGSTGAVTLTIPTDTGDLTNGAGFITSYTDEKVKSTPATATTTYYLIGSTNSSENTATTSKHASLVAYTTSNNGTDGYTELRLGNATATSSTGGKAGTIRLYGTNATYYTTLKAGAVASSNKTITFPNASGTVALTSDIPTVPTNVSAFTNDAGYITSADYITEQGTSEIWTYRKWNSGIAECWGEKSWTISSWTSWGGTYYSTTLSVINYPTNLFIAKPSVVADGHTSNGDSWLAGGGGATNTGTKDHTPSYFLMRASNGTNNITGYVSIHAIGTWK